MESYKSDTFPKTLNLFEDEEASLENLKILLCTPVGYNSSQNIDTFHPVNLKIGEFDLYPNWVQ